MPDNTPELPESSPQAQAPTLTPLQFPPDWTPGKYALFPVSPEPMYGPDELGEYKSAVDDMTETCSRADSSARLWEVLQAWEARNFARGYQFNTWNRRGFVMFGAVNGAAASGSELMQTQNAGRLFACNVYASRQDKSSSVLAMEVPSLTFVPKADADPMDQTAADEKKKYLKVWLNDAGIKDVVRKTADLMYTDDRIVYLTWSVADEQEWGTESPKKKEIAYGAPEPAGITPETELDNTKSSGDGGSQDSSGMRDIDSDLRPDQGDSLDLQEGDKPAVREVTIAYGKLEAKVPIYADKLSQFPWLRISDEVNVNILRERYPWIEEKIKAGTSVGGNDQLDRMARINVRLAVQSSSSSGESWQQDATETFTFFRPSQYRSIKKEELRKLFYDTFPLGLLVVHAGGELAFIQNRSMNKHLAVLHAKEGSGQNRRAIGSNYLPLQKILNANISLLDRYFRAAIARRFHDVEAINSETINGQANDPAKSTPVMLHAGQKIADVTGIENTPQPTTGMFEFIQWLIQGAPEAMDGMEPSMFGAATGEADQGVYQTAKLKRDAARGVYSLPWSQICLGLAKAAEQAAESAAENRVTDISSNIPGQNKLQVEISKMQGDALCYPESMEIPQTIAEQEAQMAELLEQGQNVAIYNAIANDPRNLTVFANFPSLTGLEIPGLDAVEQQEGEFELLMQSGPQPNPQYAAIQQQLQEGETHPEAQTPEGQEAMQQLQQAMQSMPPQISSVPVAQDGSENHAIHAAITLGMLTSPEGRKFKNGNDEQKAIWQNLKLHWQEHVEMGQKLTPPKEMEFRGSMTVDPSKFSPDVQSKIFQAAGLQVSPEEATDDPSLVPHEVTTEKEGVDANGVPVKQKIAMVGKGLRS